MRHSAFFFWVDDVRGEILELKVRTGAKISSITCGASAPPSATSGVHITAWEGALHRVDVIS